MRRRTERGATLLEIIISMLIIAMVSTGILTAFVFSRRVTHRSGSELAAGNLAPEILAQLRAAVDADLANGLTLTPGIYVDRRMATAQPPPGATPLAALDLPDSFLRFQTVERENPDNPLGINNHSDGRIYIVEGGVDANNNGNVDPGELQDLDGDGFTAVDFDGRFPVDLRRVKMRVQWSTPDVP